MIERLLVAAALLASVPAGARPLNLYNSMRDTPMTRFTKADTDALTKALNRTLDSGEDGATVNWENPGSPAGGSITPAKDPKGRAGCRLARVENHHGSLRNAGDYIFCKNTGNAKGPSWQLVGPWSGR